MNERCIQLLNGYLLSMRRLSRSRRDYWVKSFEYNDSVEEGFKHHLKNEGDVTLISGKSIEYKEINEVLNTSIFSHLKVQDETSLKLFAWDIIEHVDLAFIDLSKENMSLKSMLFRAESEFHGEYVYLVLHKLNHAVAIGLAGRV